MTTQENAIRYWGSGICLLGLFVMFFFVDEPPYHVTFRCDRHIGTCTLEQKGILYYQKKNIKIENIRHGRLEMVRLLMFDIEIVERDGNGISLGISTSWPFITEYGRNVTEINDFLKNDNAQFLSVEQRGYFSSILTGLFLLGGVFCIYKALNPYIAEGLTDK